MVCVVLLIPTNIHTYKMAYLSLLGDLYVCMDICRDNLIFQTKYYLENSEFVGLKPNIAIMVALFWGNCALIFFFQRLNTIIDLFIHTDICFYIYVCMYLYIGGVGM